MRSIPSGYVKIAIENDQLQWIFPLKMVIFHSYVSLPEGKLESQRDLLDENWMQWIIHQDHLP
jgi:hypothetical protein